MIEIEVVGKRSCTFQALYQIPTSKTRDQSVNITKCYLRVRLFLLTRKELRHFLIYSSLFFILPLERYQFINLSKLSY